MDFTIQEQRILETLSTLSYRAGELKSYLKEITLGVSRLIQIDWSVVTLCQNGFEQVMASSFDFEGMDNLFPLHGTVTNLVVNTGQTFTVEDVRQSPEAGDVPEGYLCYLGVPLRTAQGEIIGTICSFNHQPRQFTDQEVRTAELFAERAATAIDNYNLYQLQLQFNERLEQEVTLRTQELQAAQIKLVEQERLAALGEFAAMIVHEIRNPLTTMTMGLNYAKKNLPGELAQERLTLSLGEAERLERLLREILMYAKPQSLKLEEIEINTLIQELLISLREMPEAQNRQINLTPSSLPVKIMGDRDKLQQVFINVIRNACEAISVEEAVHCKIEGLQSDRICICVHNGGEPIPSEVLSNLTKPFYSTKPQGTGLGLAIVKRIITAHNGKLSIQSDESGTVVSIKLPVITTS